MEEMEEVEVEVGQRGGAVCMHRDRSKVTTIEDGEGRRGWTGTGSVPF